MYPANRYVIRQATAADERTLRQLAAHDGQRPLSGPALIGERAGVLRAYSRTPSVTERIRAAMAPFRAAHSAQS